MLATEFDASFYFSESASDTCTSPYLEELSQLVYCHESDEEKCWESMDVSQCNSSNYLDAEDSIAR